MASNGLVYPAKKGTCRMCRRGRTVNKLKKVGEVSHGYATGHVWECIDTDECDFALTKKLNNPSLIHLEKELIKQAVERGRFIEYKYFR